MKGHILSYSVQANSGVITGDDGKRYSFTGTDWMEPEPPQRGMPVDFETDGANALAVYRALSGGAESSTIFSTLSGGEKNKVVAGVLGIALGAFGIHKFYLGYKDAAVIHLALGGGGVACSILFSIIAIVVPIVSILASLSWLAVAASGIIGFIEGIIYLTKSDEEFAARYIAETRSWF